jgi:tetratricopeptide (TPR) repeat protein
MPELDQLEKRVSKLERGSAARFFVQYLLSPILVLALGFLFNLQLEATKSEVKRIEVAHDMVTTALSGDYEQSFITLRLVDVVLDPELAGQIKDAVIGYLKKRAIESLEQERPEEALEIIRAQEGILKEAGQEPTDEIRRAIEEAGKGSELNRAEQASALTSEGFQLLALGKYDQALEQFHQVERVYPSYGTAHEIIGELERNRDKLETPEGEREVLGTIVERYSWKVPEEDVRELKKRTDVREIEQPTTRFGRTLRPPG